MTDYEAPWRLEGDEILGEPTQATRPRSHKPRHDGNQRTAASFIAFVLVLFATSAATLFYIMYRVMIWTFWLITLSG